MSSLSSVDIVLMATFFAQMEPHIFIHTHTGGTGEVIRAGEDNHDGGRTHKDRERGMKRKER